MGKPAPTEEKKPPIPNRIGDWLTAQSNNLDPDRRSASTHIMSRLDVSHPWFSFARTLRTLEREDSPFLIGARGLASDYIEQFGQAVVPEVGSAGPFTPYEVVICRECKRQAVPGADRCGYHGGQYLSAEDAKNISRHIAARIMEGTSKAVRVLEELMDEGRSEMVRLQAATAILDRAGVGPQSKLEISVTSAGDEAAEVLRARIEQARASIAKAGEIEAANIVDAEVIEDGSE